MLWRRGAFFDNYTAMLFPSRWLIGVALSCALPSGVLLSGTARADSLDQFGLHRARGEAKFASGAGSALFLAAGTLLPLVDGDPQGSQRSVRVADALLTSTLLTEGLKRLTREERPDGSSHDSFPSEHATAAFAVAAMQAHYHRKQAAFWYGGAALIGASRVQLERHYWHDVLSGAALGYLTAQLELRQGRGLLLRPFVNGPSRANGHDQVAGFSLSRIF